MPTLLHIRGHHLPGRVWQAGDERYDNVHVRIQLGKEPHELVPGDAQMSSWTIPIVSPTSAAGRGAPDSGRPW